ncbi:hypothetical protein WT09_11420 [Burkholderia stagnalis]|uniref:hypothetical protein n=1 Tax=Burkholderia stagnalis TaxID=1503054 RepID=UPI00075624AD|nr:hypothetical protein [Burkholderia stagnalis]KVN18206.1 hypothetical protein WT09_11420 [Burkholderia stagnalis]
MAEISTVLRSDDGECEAVFDGTSTIISRQFDDQTPDVTLSSEAVRLDVLASVLRRDNWSGDAAMPTDERGVLLELMADMASEVRRLAQLTEAYVNRLQARGAGSSVQT